MKTGKLRVLSIVLSLALVTSFIPVNGIKSDTARAASRSGAAETSANKSRISGSAGEQSMQTGTYQPKHKLAKAVDIMMKAQSGELKIATDEITGHGGYYDALSDVEKQIYDSFGQIFTYFRPFSSSNDFFDKAKSSSDAVEALADDISYGNVACIELGNSFSRDDIKQMFNMASISYHFDHPYNLLKQMYRLSYIKLGAYLFVAPCHIDNSEDFDYKQWGESLVQFETDALTEIVNDQRFSDTSAPIREYLVHEFICGRVKYDGSKPDNYTLQWHKDKCAYGPMVENLGVCIGIAYMAKILLDDLEVKNYIIHSGTHAWNMVYLEGDYYELDCTWDLDSGKGISYKYFNRTTDELLTLDPKGSHIRSFDSARVPHASGTKCTYDYVCQLLNVSAAEDQDTVSNPKYSTDDYVEEEDGELYPNLEDFEYDGLIYTLYSEGYAVCTGVSGNPKSITIPDDVILTDDDGVENYYSVIMVADGAFANKKLKKVVLPVSLSYIGEKAFYKCSNLKNITFKSVEELIQIDSNAFKGIAKKPTFYICADSLVFKAAKSFIKASGVPKKSKFKRINA